MRDDSEWLAALKVGDEVLIDNRWAATIAAVDRVTSTQIIVGKSKYRRHSGRAIGADSWNPVYLRQPTQRDRDAIEVSRLRLEVETATKTAPLSTLRAMYKCIKEQQP